MKMLKKTVLMTSESSSATPVLLYEPMLKQNAHKDDADYRTERNPADRRICHKNSCPATETPKSATKGWL